MRRPAKTILDALASAGLLLVLVTFTPILSPWISWLTGPRWDTPGSADTLIVLAGDGPHDDGQIGYSSYWRAAYTVRAWREGHFRRIIVSGGHGAGETIASYLRFQGVPPDAIQVEGKSDTTHENAVEVAKILSGSGARPALLSSDFHIRRAYACFRHEGIDPLCLPAPDAGKRFQSISSRWTTFLDLCVETAKLAGYKYRGYI